MHVYLVQHAEALPSEQNPTRPLSDKGQKDAKRMGQYLKAHAGLELAEILHSGKVRASMTAELLGAALDVDCQAGRDLNPNDDPALWVSHLAMRHQDIMLVGHLPHLQRLAGLLVCNDDTLEMLRFSNGGVVCIGREDGGEWGVEWFLTPQLLPEGL